MPNHLEQQPDKSEPKRAPASIVKVAMFEAGIEFALLIAGPLIAGVLAGKWLDRKTNHHFYVIIGLLLAIALSSMAIWRRIKDYKNLLK